MRPDLLLLDEPLSNLDAQLRDRLRLELKRLQQDIGITSVYVTHDQSEALSMADTVAVMFDGVIHQFASPRDIYEEPASLKVAAFIGKSNFLYGNADAQSAATKFTLTKNGASLTSTNGWSGTGTAVGRVRVEDVQVGARPTGAVNEIAGRVTVATYQGSQVGYLMETPDGTSLEGLCTPEGPMFSKGDDVYVSFAPESLRLYQAREGEVVDDAEPSA
jgi:ABC-type Fe3+/spermidine/putrescine transport system ATPase subunit